MCIKGSGLFYILFRCLALQGPEGSEHSFVAMSLKLLGNWDYVPAEYERNDQFIGGGLCVDVVVMGTSEIK
jgi:hypothetical protein